MERPYTIEFEDRGEYLYVLVGGDKLTADVAAAYWREIAHECFKTNKIKIMIEKDFPEPVSPPEMLRMGDYLGNLLPSFKIAFLDRHRHDDINELGKRVARNKNVMMQLFDHRDEAEQWLLAN
jgi:hypothetical protein